MGGLWLRRMGAGPRLVALHGGPGLDHTSLLPLARRLSTSFEVWLPDLPGHGRSRAPSGRLPGLPQIEASLSTWLRRHVPEPAILLGHSLGAWLAREVLRQKASRTGRRPGIRPGSLVLLAPPVAGRDPALDGRRSAVRRGVRELPGPGSDPLSEILSHVRDECGGETPAELLSDLETGRLESAVAYGSLLRNLHRRLTGPLRLFTPPCDTLVVCGEDDRTTPPDVAARLGASPRTVVETMPGLGHYLHAQDPEGVAERIARFWARSER